MNAFEKKTKKIFRKLEHRIAGIDCGEFLSTGGARLITLAELKQIRLDAFLSGARTRNK